MRADKKTPLKADKKAPARGHKRGVIGYSKKSALLEDAITQMNAGKYGRSSAALKELLALDPLNMEARRLFATLHLRLGSLLPARQAFESLANEALERQDYWLAESLLREYLVAGPRCVPFIEKLGAVYQGKGDTLAASEEFAKAIDILIEDPDPDRPTLPAELYAKIRELAPASPPAFRLASLFDAQSGDLIARPVIAPPSQHAELEPAELAAPVALAAVSDPVSGVMPWDDVPLDTPALPNPSLESESSKPVISSPPLAESIVELSPAAEAPSLVDGAPARSETITEPAQVDSSITQSLSISSSDDSPLVALQTGELSRSPSGEEEILDIDSSSSVAEERAVSLSLPILQDSPNAPEAIHTAEAEPQPQPGASIPSASSTSDSLPAPLPWEQVEEATVAISQPDVEPLSLQPPGEESSVASSPEVSPLDPAHLEALQENVETESFMTEAGATLSTVTTQEFSPDVAWSVPDVSPTDPVGSSSVFPDPSPAGSGAEERQASGVDESVSPPMPWEQVQESSVIIDGSGQEPIGLEKAEVAESALAQLQEAPSAEVGIQPALEEIAPSLELGSVESHAAISAETVDMPSQPEGPSSSNPGPKVGEFSWTSIFNSAWKFGASSPAAHDSLHQPLPLKSSEPAESVLPEETTVVPLSESGESMPVSASPVSAMPWDQIHETPVTIPSADTARSAAVEPLVESSVMPVEVLDDEVTHGAPVVASVSEEELTAVVPSIESPESVPVSASPVSAMPWDQIHETPGTIPPADTAWSAAVELPVESSVTPVELTEEVAARNDMGVVPPAKALATSVSVLPEEVQPIEVAQVEPVEPSFRFVDSKNAVANGDNSEKVNQLDHSMFPDETAGEAERDVSSVLTDNNSPGVSNEFRLASQAESLPVDQDTGRQDVPGPEVEPAPVASAESAPPVLPHELLPVLQTLVDQLSVVTQKVPVVSPEPPSHEQEVVQPPTTLREPSKAPTSAELVANPSSAQMPPAESGVPSQWKTGEVAVQTHRPSAKKRKHSMDQASEPPSSHIEAQPDPHIEPVTQIASTNAEPEASASGPAQEKEDWIRTGEAIRFINQEVAESTPLSPPPPPVTPEVWRTASEPSAAASAVDVLFQSSGSQTRTQSFERTSVPSKPRPQFNAKLARVRIGLSVFVGSCFSTTRALVMSIVGLAVLCVAIVAMAIGAVGLTWLVMEEKPSPSFQSLTTTPQRTMMDSNKNGYLLLLGFEADSAADPVQSGYERKPDAKDEGMAAVCQGGDEGITGSNQKHASASVVQGWYRSADPAGQFKSQTDSFKDWLGQANVSVGRYRQWLKMPFEDWGHGQAVTPPCAAILLAHRLHVAEGFSQGANAEAGVERLEGDMEAWRTTLGQAKTLPVKMMALQAMNDDIAVASGLLVRPDFDAKILPRITKMLRPLDPVESSMRWPMQSQLVLATKSYAAQLEADRGEDVPLHVSVASMLPLPKQRRFNDYAEYYEASYKAAGEGRYGAMPKRSTYIKHPANSVMDYLVNPIENIVGVAPLPEWDHYNGLVIDTDAHLRLASLQAWLRRGPQDADLLARIAKAGQRYYDPYTGLPMLVNIRQGVMYSVGHDGKDQDADPQQDVVVSIPLNQPAASSVKPATKSK